ncbi:SDR family oxidoreductase [Saccharomonospora sp. NPDC046836]|uniref:SDR family NAD(P)-dependent oxidoreductase n=1 Tax=Saccharomonospora sp. NPDC046836 TaxID=3156921 RepID=UPI003402402A
MKQVSVITGGTAGIGLACARELLDAGGTVVISGRSAERGRKALAELDAGASARYIPADVTEVSDIDRLIEETITDYGRIDVLVNNAGGMIDTGELVVNLDDDALNRSFNLNVNSAFWTSRAALRHMLPRGYGRIINMSSIAGKIGAPALAGYISTKHALIGFTKALAQEVTALGVTVNAICPGITDTDMLPRQFKGVIEKHGADFEDGLSHYIGGLARKNTPAEVGALVAFLSDPKASGISGCAYSVDGAFTHF